MCPVIRLWVKCKMYKARDASPSIKPDHAPRARVSLAPGPEGAACHRDIFWSLIEIEKTAPQLLREPRQTTSKHETLYIIGKGWRNISGIKYSPFQLLIVALVWVGIAQRRRNNLITTNKINKKVNCKKAGGNKSRRSYIWGPRRLQLQGESSLWRCHSAVI